MKLKKRKLFFLATLIFTICLTSGVSAKIVDDTIENTDVLNRGRNPDQYYINSLPDREFWLLGREKDDNGRSILVLMYAGTSNSDDQYITIQGTNLNLSNVMSQLPNLYRQRANTLFNSDIFISSTATLKNLEGNAISNVSFSTSISGKFLPIDYKVANLKVYDQKGVERMLNKLSGTYSYIINNAHSNSIVKFNSADNMLSNDNTYTTENKIDFMGVVRVYEFKGKEVPDVLCTNPNEEMTSDGKACVCKSGYERIDNHGLCEKKEVKSTLDDVIESGAQTADGTTIEEKNELNIKDDGRVTTKDGKQVYDKDGNALYIKPSNIKQEQVKVEDTGISSYIGYILGFIVLAIGSVVVYISLKKHKKAKQM